MRGLFKMESARGWASILIFIGVILIVAAFIVGGVLALFMILLGIVFIVIGCTVNKLCTSISQMMQEYDEELHKKLSEIKASCISKDPASKAP